MLNSKDFTSDTKTLVDAIKAGVATDQTYIDAIRFVFAPTPYMIDGVIGMFRCHVAMGLSLQSAFNEAIECATNSMLEGSPKIDPDLFLNGVLGKAKSAELAYEKEKQKIKDGDDRNDALIKDLYQASENAWSQLYRAIDQSLPVRFLTEDGGVNTMAAIASMDSDRCLYYSTSPDAKLCLSGVVLSRVAKLEKA
jgi:hypothetical protein